MAVRGTSARRSTEGPLSGVLRDLDQRTRRMDNRRRATPAEAEPAASGPQGKPGPPGPPGAPGRTAAAAIVRTGPGGRAVWCPDPAHGELVVSAVAAGPNGPYIVDVETAEPGRVVLRVWALVRHGRGMRWARAAEGTPVHVTGSRPGEAPAGAV
ncbi:hypothetical protein [Streptomyces alfalfae]